MQSKLSTVMNNSGSPLPYLPSQLHLSKTNNYPNRNFANSVDADTIAYLQRRFGKHTCCDFMPLPNPNYPNVPFIDWNGDGKPNEELFLEGEQCLVFHLGGIPVYSPPNSPPLANVAGAITMVGFSNNPQNPAACAGNTAACWAREAPRAVLRV